MWPIQGRQTGGDSDDRQYRDDTDEKNDALFKSQHHWIIFIDQQSVRRHERKPSVVRRCLILLNNLRIVLIISSAR